MRLRQFWTGTKVWEGVIRNVHYIGPIRSPVPRYHVRGRTGSFIPGSGGEQLQRLMRSGASAGDAEARLAAGVDEWFSERLGFLESLRVVSVDREGVISSLVGDEIGGFQGINIANMGEGVSQFLPIVAEALLTRADDILLVEQPEIHLHPRAQADMGDLFIDRVVKEARAQCIVETHSEHLLLRVRRRVAEGKISPDDVAVIYVGKSRGESQAEQLHLNRKGYFQEWPEGFFEEGYEEAVKLAEAASEVDDA